MVKKCILVLTSLLVAGLLLSGCKLGQRSVENATPEPPPAETGEVNIPATQTDPKEGLDTEGESQTESLPTVEPEVELAAEPPSQAGSWMEIPDQFIFFDNFQTGSSDRWVVGNGWTVQQYGQYYTFDSRQKGLSLIKGGGLWENYLLRGQVLLHEGTMAFNIAVSQSGRYLMLYNADGLFVIKEDFITGDLTPLARTDPPELGRWHWLGIAVQNGQIQVGADSILLIDITDPTPLIQGTAGVSSGEDSHVRVDNIVITQLEAPLLTPGELDQTEVFELPEEVAQMSDVPVADFVEPETDDNPEENVEEEEEEEVTQEEAAPASGADLLMKSVSIPKPWIAGEPLNVTMNIQNLGPEPAGPFTLVWFPLADGVVGKSWDIDGLGAGELLTLEYTFEGYQNAGTVTWEVLVDSESEINDPRPLNNTRSGTMTITDSSNANPSANMYIDYWGAPKTSQVGEIYEAYVVVGNLGPDTSETMIAVWYPFGDDTIGASWEVAPLEPGETTVLEFSFDGYTESGEVTWTFVMDPDQVTNDPDVMNNACSFTIGLNP